MARLTGFLDLDTSQQAKAAAIFAAAGSDPDARRAAMAKLEAILRPDQKAKLEAMRAKRAAERASGGGGEQ